MTTRCYETSLLLFANARRAGTLLTVKCPAPGTHRETNARGLPGGMLAVGIDSHISSQTYRFDLQRRSKTDKIKQEFLLPSFKNSRGGGYSGVKRIGMTVGNPGKLP